MVQHHGGGAHRKPIFTDAWADAGSRSRDGARPRLTACRWWEIKRWVRGDRTWRRPPALGGVRKTLQNPPHARRGRRFGAGATTETRTSGPIVSIYTVCIPYESIYWCVFSSTCVFAFYLQSLDADFGFKRWTTPMESEFAFQTGVCRSSLPSTNSNPSQFTSESASSSRSAFFFLTPYIYIYIYIYLTL